MLAVLVLGVLVLIVFQISMGSSVDMRVAQNDLELANFDAAIESAMMKTMQDLANDAGSGAGGGAGADLSGASAGGLGGALSGAAGGGGEEAGAVDSRRDEWARPQQTEINGVSLRILIQDENSKYNVLTMLTEDQDEADKSFDRVVRILDLCREGTLSDIDEPDARQMAEGMREFMRDRKDAVLPKPELSTDGDNGDFPGLPLTLREFVVLPGFNEYMFRDYRDAEDVVVHSIGSFLTVSTAVSTYEEFLQAVESGSIGLGAPQAEDGASGGPGGVQTGSSSATTAGGAPAAGTVAAGGGLGSAPVSGGVGAGGGNGTPGVAVNINTAPNAVLHGLADRQDVPWSFLDDLLKYRNEEDEQAGSPDGEPVYDEYGEEVTIPQIFESLEELEDVDGWSSLEPDAQADFKRFLTVESGVFSIFITARASITPSGGNEDFGQTRQERQTAEEKGTDRVRTVRAIVWRYEQSSEFKIVPLEAWEVLDYVPFEVLDFPEDER